MAFIKHSQVIKKPIEEVFKAVVDVANFPKWNPTTTSARKVTTGTRFELEIRGFGKGVFKTFIPLMGSWIAPGIRHLPRTIFWGESL